MIKVVDGKKADNVISTTLCEKIVGGDTERSFRVLDVPFKTLKSVINVQTNRSIMVGEEYGIQEFKTF